MALLILAMGYAILGTVRMNEIFVGNAGGSGRHRMLMQHGGSESLSLSHHMGEQFLLNTNIDGSPSTPGASGMDDSSLTLSQSEQPLYHAPIGEDQFQSMTNSSHVDFLNQVVSIYQSYETQGGCDEDSEGNAAGGGYAASFGYRPPPPPGDDLYEDRSGASSPYLGSYVSSQYSASRRGHSGSQDEEREDASFSVFSTVSDILTMGNPIQNPELEGEYSPLHPDEQLLRQGGQGQGQGSPVTAHTRQFRVESGADSVHTGTGSGSSQSQHTGSSDPYSFSSRAHSYSYNASDANTAANASRTVSQRRLAAYYTASRSAFQRSIHSWRMFMHATWKYNGLSIVFVSTFCLSTLVIGPFLFFLDYVWWFPAVHAGEDFTECLVKASLSCPEQTQEAVDSFAREMCGAVPGHRPNQIMVRGV
jgi:hypothetical protein